MASEGQGFDPPRLHLEARAAGLACRLLRGPFVVVLNDSGVAVGPTRNERKEQHGRPDGAPRDPRRRSRQGPGSSGAALFGWQFQEFPGAPGGYYMTRVLGETPAARSTAPTGSQPGTRDVLRRRRRQFRRRRASRSSAARPASRTSPFRAWAGSRSGGTRKATSSGSGRRTTALRARKTYEGAAAVRSPPRAVAPPSLRGEVWRNRLCAADGAPDRRDAASSVSLDTSSIGAACVLASRTGRHFRDGAIPPALREPR